MPFKVSFKSFITKKNTMFSNNYYFEVQSKPNKNKWKTVGEKIININEILKNTKINGEVFCVRGQENSVS